MQRCPVAGTGDLPVPTALLASPSAQGYHCGVSVIRTDLLVASPIFLIGLHRTLTSAGIKVVAARTAVEQEPSWLADVVLIDVDALWVPDGFAYLAEAVRYTPVLVLDNRRSTAGDECLRAGATGIVSKDETAEGLVDAVRAVIAGTRVDAGHADARTQPSDVSDALPERLADRLSERLSDRLSEREEQVLGQISHGLTHGQIATRLGISPHTVDTYVKRIRAKLGAGNKAELTRAALLGRLVGSGPRVP